MSDTYVDWLYRWHAILDRELGPDADAKENVKLEDQDCDFRMNFGTWGLPDYALRECFEMLPLGEQIADRVLNDKVWGQGAINSAEAIFRFRKAITDVSTFVDIDVDPTADIRVIRATVPQAKALGLEDAIPFDVLSEDIWEARQVTDPAYGSAMSLVHETLYQRTTLFEGLWYVLWPYIDDPDGVDPFGNLMRIRNSEISFKKDKNGLIVLYDDDHTISYSKNIELDCGTAGYIDIINLIYPIVTAFIQDYTARGFPAARFEEIELYVQHKDPGRIVNRLRESPETPYTNERPFVGTIAVKNGEIYLKPGSSLYFKVLDDGLKTESFNMRIHVKNGRLQRGESLFDA